MIAHVYQYKLTAVMLLIFSQPPEEHDPQSQLHMEREWRFERNSKVRREAAKQQAKTGKTAFNPYIAFVRECKGGYQ